MATEHMSIVDRYTQEGLGEALRERYDDPRAVSLSSDLDDLLRDLRRREERESGRPVSHGEVGRSRR